MMARWRWFFLFLANVPLASAAQLASSTTPPKIEASASVDPNLPPDLDLQLLTRRAALIFKGTVIEIDMNEPTPGPPKRPDSGVGIKFQVDEGIRGVATGAQLTIREWRGLWRRGTGERYRLGERMLIFYHAPGTSGFSSPVSGDGGRFTIKADDRILLTSPQRRALMRASRLRTTLTDDQILRGQVKYEQVAKIVRQIVEQ